MSNKDKPSWGGLVHCSNCAKKLEGNKKAIYLCEDAFFCVDCVPANKPYHYIQRKNLEHFKIELGM